MTNSRQQRRLLDAACEIAREAGRAILDVYGRDDFAVSRKSDDSPLTEADEVAHGIISRALAQVDACLPILSEESLPSDHAERRKWHLLARRSARRHEGVPEAQRRVHGQHRARR
jgi:3'(2'), 5'-bisphosphate nucleotidase